MYKEVAGAILAGGESRRMGFPKQLLTLKDRRIVEHVLDVLKFFFDEILIITDNKNRFAGFKGVEIVEDIIKGCGPLGGIYTGLKRSSRDRVFFVACDMPFLHNGLMERLLRTSRDESFDCIIARSDKGIEPLHGIYSRNILSTIEESLDKGELSVSGILAKSDCRYIKARKDEIASFSNINTPEDLGEIELS